MTTLDIIFAEFVAVLRCTQIVWYVFLRGNAELRREIVVATLSDAEKKKKYTF